MLPAKTLELTARGGVVAAAPQMTCDSPSFKHSACTEGNEECDRSSRSESRTHFHTTMAGLPCKSPPHAPRVTSNLTLPITKPCLTPPSQTPPTPKGNPDYHHLTTHKQPPTNHLPTYSPLKPAELQVLRAQYDKESEGSYISLQTKFNLAWGLIKSASRPDQQEGVTLLSEIFRASPDRRRECLYYLALGNYKLGNYGEARRYNDSLLEMEEGNLQALSLRGLVEERVAREGVLGVAIVGGLAAAAAVGGGFLVRGSQRNR